MSSRLTFSVLLVFLIPMLVPASISPITVVVAESNCDDGEFVSPNWNKTVERLAKIPTVFDYDNEYADDRDRRDGKEDDDDDQADHTNGDAFRDEGDDGRHDEAGERHPDAGDAQGERATLLGLGLVALGVRLRLVRLQLRADVLADVDVRDVDGHNLKGGVSIQATIQDGTRNSIRVLKNFQVIRGRTN